MASPAFREHFLSPRHQGGLEQATHRGRATDETCGDWLELDLEVAGGRVRAVAYRVRGCSGSIAAGSMLCTLLAGGPARLPADLRTCLAQALGELPPGKGHALDLAVAAARAALPPA